MARALSPREGARFFSERGLVSATHASWPRCPFPDPCLAGGVGSRSSVLARLRPISRQTALLQTRGWTDLGKMCAQDIRNLITLRANIGTQELHPRLQALDEIDPYLGQNIDPWWEPAEAGGNWPYHNPYGDLSG